MAPTIGVAGAQLSGFKTATVRLKPDATCGLYQIRGATADWLMLMLIWFAPRIGGCPVGFASERVRMIRVALSLLVRPGAGAERRGADYRDALGTDTP